MRACVSGQFSHLLSPVYFLPGLQLWLKSSLGVTVAAGKVTAWQDQSGYGNHASFNGDPTRPDTDKPSYVAAGGPNAEPSVLFDGVDDSLSNNTMRYTVPFYYWAVCRQVTWADGNSFWTSLSEPSLVGRIGQLSATPEIVQTNGSAGSNANLAMTLNQYFIVQARFANSVDDFLQVGATKVTGQNAGNDAIDHPGYRLGANQDPGAWGNIELVELIMANCKPDAVQLSNMQAYGAAFYPGLPS